MSEDTGCTYRKLAERCLEGAEAEILMIAGYDDWDFIDSHMREETEEYFNRFKGNKVPPRIDEVCGFNNPSALEEVNLRYYIDMARRAISYSMNKGDVLSRIADAEEKADIMFGKEE